MKKIEGIITYEDIKGDYIVLEPYGKLASLYSVYDAKGGDITAKLYLRAMPSFDDVYNCFMSCSAWFLKMNKTQDICLSLFYNPFFTEFYERIKTDVNGIPKSRLNFLKNNMLNYLADEMQYKIIVEEMKSLYPSPWFRNYYIEKDIYNKSKELLELLSKVK